jgi:hypothetical protein
MSEPETQAKDAPPEEPDVLDMEAESLMRRLRCYELRVLVSALEAFGDYQTGDAIDSIHNANVRTANRIGED